jgi:cation:H+ antiporter
MGTVVAFLLTGAVVASASVVLTRSADRIAEATGIGRVWVGSILLAGATSLPEAATDVAAVRLGAPDLAVGDLFGSSLANMVVLALVDLYPPRGRLLRGANPAHAVSAAQAIVLNALGGLCVLLPTGLTLLGVGPGPLLLAAGYLLGTRMLFRSAPAEAAAPVRGAPSAAALLGFAGAAAVVLVASPAFASSAAAIAEASGLGTTFVGTWLVGMSTSLPELVACVTAVRMRALDLAVGNLFGSNAFNMAIFLVLDLAHPGALFTALDPAHALTAFLAVVLMGFGIAAMGFRRDRAVPILDPDSVLILVAYAVGMGILYARATG